MAKNVSLGKLVSAEDVKYKQHLKPLQRPSWSSVLQFHPVAKKRY